MARNKSPQTFEKRQRERRKKMKRDDKFERRLDRKAEKRRAKADGEPLEKDVIEIDETGLPVQPHSREDYDY